MSSIRWMSTEVGVELHGLSGMCVRLIRGPLDWHVTIDVEGDGPIATYQRRRFADARDLALERAIAFYPAVIEHAYRGGADRDVVRDMLACQRSLLRFGLAPVEG